MANGDNVICAVCGASCASDAKFCSQCGAKLIREESTVICSECGYVCTADAKFCPNCGTRLAQSEPSSDAEQVKSEPSSSAELTQSEPSPDAEQVKSEPSSSAEVAQSESSPDAELVKTESASNAELRRSITILKKDVNDMLAHLKFYAFQELEVGMLTNLNRDQSYPSLQELDEIIKSMAELQSKQQDNDKTTDKTVAIPSITQSQIEEMLAQQRKFVQYLDGFTPTALPSMLTTCESQKICYPGTSDWLSLKQKYEDICEQLKVLNKFESGDVVDFTQLFHGSLNNACDNAALTAHRIMHEIGDELQDVCANSVQQISWLNQLNKHLLSIRRRLV